MPPLIALSNGTTFVDRPVNPGYVESVPSTFGTKGSQAKWRDRHMDTRVMPTTGFDPYIPLHNFLAPVIWHERTSNNPADLVQESAIPGGPVVFVPPGAAQSTANAAYDVAKGNTSTNPVL